MYLSRATVEIFQFTPLREGQRSMERERLSGRKFQFTPLREGQLDADNPQQLLLSDFNSRPCVRGNA